MSAKYSIEWTDASWTPVRARVKENAGEIAAAKGYTSLVQIATKMQGHVGPHCERISPGCGDSTGGGCYSERDNGRCLPHNGTGLPFDRRSRDLADMFLDEKILIQPLHWKKPRRIFVCSQTDLFADFVTDEMIDRVFAVMALCPQHSFQVLTKRAERMEQWTTAKRHDPNTRSTFKGFAEAVRAINSADPKVARLHGVDPLRIAYDVEMGRWQQWWPLPNVWLGVSVEDQQRADERIQHLLKTPAAVRFLSVEPLLGQVDLRRWLFRGCCSPHIHWVIVGGESGPGARPMHPEWVRDIRDRSVEAGVPFFFKQWGGHRPMLEGEQWRPSYPVVEARKECGYYCDPGPDGFGHYDHGVAAMVPVGKKKAGRQLDGRTWDEMPVKS